MIHDYFQQKIDDSKEVLKLAAEMSKEYYHAPLIITYSGGKDSDVLLQLALECLNPEDFEVINSHTTLDAPETVYYIRDKFKELAEKGVKTTIQYPRYKDGRFMSIWSLILDIQTPPTRFSRYCCARLKEASCPNRFVAVGVREAESIGRRGRDVFATRGKKKADANFYSTDHIREVFEDDKARRKEGRIQNPNEKGVFDCQFISKAKENNELICNPIYRWTDSEVWQFINERGMKYNPLYDKGFYRVGCIGCPLAGNQAEELDMYPKYKEQFIRTFDKMLEKRKAAGKDDVSNRTGVHRWTDGEAVYRWWTGDTSIQGQMNIFDYEDDDF